MKRQFGLVTVLALIATFIFGSAGTVGAAGSTVVVTSTNSQGWTTSPPVADNRPVSSVTFETDATSPAPTGALQMTTDATTTSKAQYMHAANTPLKSVTELSYYTKQVSAPFAGADPSYQLPVCLTGVADAATGTCNPGLPGTVKSTSFTTFVFEPYENGTVIPGTWQKWNVATGQFWSTRTVVCSGGTIVGTAGGPASYTLAAIKTACPNAVVIGYGVNIGSNNPSYTVRTDLFDFNGTTYNFELYSVPTNENQCKNGGYKTFNPPTGPFKNQGQCVSYVENHSHDGNDHQGDGGDGQHGDGNGDGNGDNGQHGGGDNGQHGGND